MPEIVLLRPAAPQLDQYVDALHRGWSPDTVNPKETTAKHLDRIKTDRAAFLASLDDLEAKGESIELPDGSLVPRLPGFTRWIWDGAFCGSINLRWQRGTSTLPPDALGPVGYTIVPWKRGARYAKCALMLLLPEIRQQGLSYVELTTDPENIASQKVISAAGGKLVERFRKAEAYGEVEKLRFRIEL
jgi:predicted acetyltransferase